MTDELVALKAKGTELLKSGKLADARDAYSKALALDPDRKHAEAHIVLANRALTHLKLDNPKAAKADCTESIHLNPKYGKSLFRRAQAHEALKELKDAFQDVRELLRLEPSNKEAVQFASRLKRSIEELARKSDLSSPVQAVETLKACVAGSDEQVQAVGKLSKIADDGARATELLHAGAVDALIALLPSTASLAGSSASQLQMPLVGLVVEALDRIGMSSDAALALRTIGGGGDGKGADPEDCDAIVELEEGAEETTADKVLAIVALASNARAEFGVSVPGAAASHDHEGNGPDEAIDVSTGAETAAGAATTTTAAEDKVAADKAKNLLIVAKRGMSLIATLAGNETAVGTQTAQGSLLVRLLPYLAHADAEVQRTAQDCLIRMVNLDAGAAASRLPEILNTLIWQLGDEESQGHRVAVAVLMKLMGKGKSAEEAMRDEASRTGDKSKVPLDVLRKLREKMDGTYDKKKQAAEDDESARTKALCEICQSVLSPILRSDASEWDQHVAAIHGVTAVLEVNKEVGAWLLRQESIFWSLAEAAEMDDEDLTKSLAEIYAHAANDPQHFRDEAGNEPIGHLRTMLKSPKPRVRCRACVALAKVCLLHPAHRVNINPTGRLLGATLGLLEAKVPPSVHRWAVEALMFLTVLPDIKRHLADKSVAFGSMVSLSQSVKEDATIHFALMQAFRRLCVGRDKTDDEKRLEQEMDKEQIEQMRQLSAGGVGAAPAEKEDDPEVLTKLAYQLVKDDAVLVIAELVAHAGGGSSSIGSKGGDGGTNGGNRPTSVLNRPAAQVLLQMATTPEARGKMVQQGGFKALLTLTVCDDAKTRTISAWGLAKIGISIDPQLYPRRTGSGPEAMVKPLLQLVDEAENELQQFEACLTLTNLATVPELRDRIVKANGWRTLEMALTCDNELVQRATVECMSNLVVNDDVLDKFTKPESTAVKVFVGFAGAEDEKTQVAATGGLATIAGVPEVAEALIAAKVLDPLVEICLIGESAAVVHRASVCLARLLEVALEKVVGPIGGPVPDHAMLALGALSHLRARAASFCVPAQQAAEGAIAAIAAERNDVKLPPPELVAEAVEKLKAEHEKRVAEQEAEEKAQREAEAAAEEEAKAKAEARAAKKAQRELNPVAEGTVEDDDSDDEDDGLEVI